MKKNVTRILAMVICIVSIFCITQVCTSAMNIEDRIGVEEDEILLIDIAGEFGFEDVQIQPESVNEEPAQAEAAPEAATEEYHRSAITFAQILEAIFGFLFIF